MKRQRFLLSSASALGLAACSTSSGIAPLGNLSGSVRRAAGQKPAVRMEIREFSADPKRVAALRLAVQKMKAVGNARNVGSWNYWWYSHWTPHGNPPQAMWAVWDQCKHHASFFAAWHRGFLIFFERQLQLAAGDPTLNLPYWDYYADPKMPQIFVRPTLRDGSPNPLYLAGRKNDVITGLSYAPFANDVTVFPYGPGGSFEDFCERNPHDHVHVQIGGSMGRVPTAPQDPIFWLHHCNIDRLWSAWVAAGGGRAMPAEHDLYMKTRFFYDLKRQWTGTIGEFTDSTNFGYTYDNLELPVAPAGATLPGRPAIVATAANATAGPIELGHAPASVALAAKPGTRTVSLEGVELLGGARDGGAGVTVYANLPERGVPAGEGAAFEIGEIGSFELSMPGMRGMGMNGGATLTFELGDALQRQERLGLRRSSTLVLSFVPFGADRSTAAPFVRIERIRV